jgi:phosphonate transport system substrate-binding protein
MSRRSLVRFAAGFGSAGALGALLSACGAATPTAAPAKPTEAPKPVATTAPAATSAAAAATKPAVAPTLAPATAPTLAPASTPAAGATPAAAAPGAAAAQTLNMAFVPSSNSQKVLDSGKPLGDALGKITGYKFEVSVPTSYAAVIEAMGSGKVDIGWLAPFAYVLAHDKYGADVMLITTRQNSKTYVSQIITADPAITKVDDLKGKKFAFVDSASASGYLYPSAYLKDKGFDPKTFFSDILYAGGHDKVVIAVYNKQVSGGATFGRSSTDPSAPLTDARTLVKSTLPDVLDKVKIIAETDPIPNDTVSARKGLDKAIFDKVKSGLLQLAKQDDGKKLLADLYQIDGLADAQDSDFDPIRKKAQQVGVNIEQAVIPPPAKPTAGAGPTGAAGSASPPAAATGTGGATASPAATSAAGATPATKP